MWKSYSLGKLATEVDEKKREKKYIANGKYESDIEMGISVVISTRD